MSSVVIIRGWIAGVGILRTLARAKYVMHTSVHLLWSTKERLINYVGNVRWWMVWLYPVREYIHRYMYMCIYTHTTPPSPALYRCLFLPLPLGCLTTVNCRSVRVRISRSGIGSLCSTGTRVPIQVHTLHVWGLAPIKGYTCRLGFHYRLSWFPATMNHTAMVVLQWTVPLCCSYCWAKPEQNLSTAVLSLGIVFSQSVMSVSQCRPADDAGAAVITRGREDKQREVSLAVNIHL